MSEFKNPEHFNVSGDKTVTVTVTFDVGSNVNWKTALANAAEYLSFYKSNDRHKSWGRSISIEEKT